MDDEFIASITSNVIQCLTSSFYFEKLDDLLSPENNSGASETCDGTHKLSESILQASELGGDDLTDVFTVLQSKGGCCDCEVLYNVAEKSRLKAEYWNGRASGQPTNVKPHSHQLSIERHLLSGLAVFHDLRFSSCILLSWPPYF